MIEVEKKLCIGQKDKKKPQLKLERERLRKTHNNKITVGMKTPSKL